MYEVGDVLPIEQLDPGTYLLAGPAMTGKYRVILDILEDGVTQNDGALLVSTNESAAEVFSAIETRLGSVPESFRIVDCISEQQGSGQEYPADRVEYVSSAADLTGIGIGVSEQLRRFVEDDTERIRVGFHSVSTLLMYVELETVFRFVHVVSGRIDGIDGLGVFALDPTTHDEGTVNTLKQLFDGMIEIRTTNGDQELQFSGIPGSPDGWTPLG